MRGPSSPSLNGKLTIWWWEDWQLEKCRGTCKKRGGHALALQVFFEDHYHRQRIRICWPWFHLQKTWGPYLFRWSLFFLAKGGHWKCQQTYQTIIMDLVQGVYETLISEAIKKRLEEKSVYWQLLEPIPAMLLSKAMVVWFYSNGVIYSGRYTIPSISFTSLSCRT